MTYLLSKPSLTLISEATIPGDKSISHRAIMFGAIAEGQTRIEGILEGDDVLATLNAFELMGVAVDRPSAGVVIVEGVGKYGLTEPAHPLDLGNSGTSMRLLSGLLAGQRFDTVLTGDESLKSRPMARVIEPLSEMGADIESQDNRAPLIIRGCSELQGIKYVLPVASAQVKSAVLLAGLYASGETSIVEPVASRDHTERMFRAFSQKSSGGGKALRISGDETLVGQTVRVPSDISSAAFFIVAACLLSGSKLVLKRIGINPTRDAVLRILTQMGAKISCSDIQDFSNEPVCDLIVYSSELHGIDVSIQDVAGAIDEFPIIAVAAAAATGITRIRGAAELRVKESDRITAMVNGLRALGIEASETPDGMDITGGQLKGGQVESYGDHRIAMAFAVAGGIASEEIKICDADNIATSFPDFVEIANQVGLDISELESTENV